MTQIIVVVTIAVLTVVLLFAMFMVARNDWTFKARMSVLNDPNLSIADQMREYRRLPSYDVMVWRVWVWDVEKFKGPVQ